MYQRCVVRSNEPSFAGFDPPASTCVGREWVAVFGLRESVG